MSRLRQQGVAQVRRGERQLVEAAEAQRRRHQIGQRARFRMLPLPAFEQAQARGTQAGGLCAIRGACGRRLRNQHQGQGLRQAQAVRRLAEINQAGRADALDVLAIGQQIDLGFEDVVLGVAQFQPQGVGDLAQLAAGGAGVEPVQQARQLHGDGGAALACAAAIGFDQGAQQRRRVYSRMPAEMLVLVQQQGLAEGRRDLLQRRPQPVLLVVGQGQAQQAAVGVEHRGGTGDLLAQAGVRPQAQQQCAQYASQHHGRQPRASQFSAPRAARRPHDTASDRRCSQGRDGGGGGRMDPAGAELP